MPSIRNSLNRLKEKIQALLAGFIVILKKLSPCQTTNGPVWPNKFQWKQFFKILGKTEKYSFWIFIILIAFSLFLISRGWYLFHTEIGPSSGGSYTEAAIGSPRYLNPILSSTNDVDRDISSIIFSGLLKYDYNGKLIGDLAEKYTISDDKKTYNFFLRGGVKWHDGNDFTADDVIFTVQTIQNPEYRSSLRASLQGVEAEKISSQEISFTLKNPYSPFLDNLTFGILPKHIWENIPAVSFSLSENNLNPIGTGPYKISGEQKDSAGAIKEIKLAPFANYYFGKPYLDSIIFKFFKDEESALIAYGNGSTQSISYISAKNLPELRASSNIHKINLPRYFAVFFNQSENKALTDKNVHQAMSLAADKQEIVSKTISGQATAIDSPIPEFIWNEQMPPIENKFNLDQAKALLDSSGWTVNATTTLREKIIDKQPVLLEISLLTVNWPELIDVANALKFNWEKIGIKINIDIKSVAEIQELIKARQYQSLLFGQILGADPDPFAFWHSSQKKDPGLNLALYENKDADKLLEEIRTESNPDILMKKYAQFNKIVNQDLPALFLYSPIYIFPTDSKIKGIDIENIHLPCERFSQINKWYIKTKRVWK